MSGKVWLVGAGPGDPGLFTLKGKNVLEKAQVVVYDALVGQGVLSMIPEDAELINVGKRANNHTMVQDDINKVLAEKALEGKRVVRLKGGDPFLFGRGGEELELLTKEGIPYEIVPGITSAISVPAYNGIPVTHRDFCSSLHIVTGHKRAGESYDIDFEALVRTKGTLVFLMGISALGDIMEGLLKAGIDKSMPAAVLSKGTTAGQKRICATVATLQKEVEEKGVVTPAIIVVGKVVSVSEEFAWFEKQPLGGYKVLVTRPKQMSSEMSEKLREKGAEVLELPAIRTIPTVEALKQALRKLSRYDWIVFTSPIGVRTFFDAFSQEGMDIRQMAGCKIAAIGTGTEKELRKWNLHADLMPEIFDGEALGEALANVLVGTEEILIPRAAMGNQELVQKLLQVTGVKVNDVATYDTLYENQTLIDEKKEFELGNIDCAVFTSASTVKGFAQAVEGLDFTGVKAVCIGKQTKAAADVLGMKTYMAEEATMDSLVACVEKLARESE